MQCWNATLFRRARWAKPLLAALLIAAACLFRQAVAAPPMRFERLGIDDGLSQQAVLAIARDTTGFMWFGTEDGLDRFDGYSFQHILQSRADSCGLTDAFVTDVQFSPNGRLWVATDGGAVVWRDPLELNLADMALYRAKVRRDAWLGWCGLPRAARQTEIFRLVSVDPKRQCVTAISTYALRAGPTTPLRKKFRRGACGACESTPRQYPSSRSLRCISSGASRSLSIAIIQTLPKESDKRPSRIPKNMSVIGIRTVAPARTACSKRVSGDSTKICAVKP